MSTINFKAIGLLEVQNPSSMVHVLVSQLESTRGPIKNGEGEKYHYVKIHESWCSSHDNSDIKGVILQSRTEPKAGLAFDLRNTTTLTQS